MRPTRSDPPKSFEDLIANYYGRARPQVTHEDVVLNYYGKPWRAGPAAHVLSLSRDDGEILPQERSDPAADRYLVDDGGGHGDFEEYVVDGGPAQITSRAATHLPPPTPAAAPSPATTYESPAEPGHGDVPADPDVVTFAPTGEPVPSTPPPSAAAPVTHGGAPVPLSEQRTADLDEDQLAADMQAILSGQKVYDPATRTTVDRDRLGGASPAGLAGSPSEPDPGQPPPVSNEQAIFDRIADSMSYANAYDLGTMELENRFSDFDRIAELQQKAKDRKAAERRADKPVAPTVGGADFLEDLDAIREGAQAAGADVARRATEGLPTAALAASIAGSSDSGGHAASCLPSALRLAVSEPDLAQPMFESGEHALAGADVYASPLLVGPPPCVEFSYGQLIAMGDLYRGVLQMQMADVDELRRIKALIERSVEYYKTNKTNPALRVTDEMWDTATGGRYLELAQNNYEHFSPNILFTGPVAATANKRGSNRSAWEASHLEAIRKAKHFGPPADDVKRVPGNYALPLTINAFGDHFLTDAFSAGHLISKELMIAYFKNNFFKTNFWGTSLNDDGEAFFDRVAKKAFVGEVKEKFSALEPVYSPIIWRPNIDSIGMFTRVLTAAAEQEPEKIGNLAVKALHDHLDEFGIEVINGAGDGPWRLTGDDFMDDRTLAIMRRAIQQSVDNILDPAIHKTDDFKPFLERVWRHVPQLPPASHKKLQELVLEYTNPKSVTLSDAAASILTKGVDSLIKVLLEAKKLKVA